MLPYTIQCKSWYFIYCIFFYRTHATLSAWQTTCNCEQLIILLCCNLRKRIHVYFNPLSKKKKKSLSSKSDLGTRTKCKSSLVVVSTCSDYPMAGSTKLQRNIWVSAVEKQLKTITEYDWNIISLVPGVPPFQSFLFFSFQATSECKTNLTHPERLEDVFVSSFHKVFQWSLRSHVRPLLQWRKQFLSVDPQQH